MIRARRSIEEFSISFLDVICCGFGAVILLLMISQNQLPTIITQTIKNDQLSIETRKSELESVVKTLQAKKIEVDSTKGELSNRALELAEIQEKLNEPELFKNPKEAESLVSEYETAKDKASELMKLWESLEEKLRNEENS